MDYGAVAKEFGIAGMYQIGVIALLFLIVKWVLQFTKDQKASHDAERKVWHELDTAKLKVLDSIIDSLKRHDEKAEERGNDNREEHKDFMVKQQVHTEQMIEVCSALRRINGLTDHK